MVIAGIVAGGTGSRMSKAYREGAHREVIAQSASNMGAMGSIPKQFMEVGGKPIILHTIERFLESPDIDAVVIGVHPDWKEYLESLLEESLLQDCRNMRNMPVQEELHHEEQKAGNSQILVIAGGGDRTDTLNRIVEEAAARWQLSDEDILVTHDAVRPFVTQEIIHENVLAAREHGICGTAIAATDTILHSCDGESIADIPLRSEMYQAQTPQSFQYGIYRDVYHSLTQEELRTLTDACGMFYRKGCKVYMVPGDVRNFKITYPQDLMLAEVLVRG